MLRFNRLYFLIASGLLVVEVVIALYVHDGLIRPYAGDFLATIFLYCLLRSGAAARWGKCLGAALLISYLIEGLQYLDLLHWLGWEHSRVARTVLGSHFAWADVLAYTLGALAVAVAEGWLRPAGTARPRAQPQ